MKRFVGLRAKTYSYLIHDGSEDSVSEVFFFYLSFLSHDIHNSQDCMGRGRLFVVPLYDFHPFTKH